MAVSIFLSRVSERCHSIITLMWEVIGKWVRMLLFGGFDLVGIHQFFTWEHFEVTNFFPLVRTRRIMGNGLFLWRALYWVLYDLTFFKASTWSPHSHGSPTNINQPVTRRGLSQALVKSCSLRHQEQFFMSTKDVIIFLQRIHVLYKISWSNAIFLSMHAVVETFWLGPSITVGNLKALFVKKTVRFSALKSFFPKFWRNLPRNLCLFVTYYTAYYSMWRFATHLNSANVTRRNPVF